MSRKRFLFASIPSMLVATALCFVIAHGQLPPKALPADLALVPKDALGFVHASVGELLKQKPYQTLLKQKNPETGETFDQFFGKKVGFRISEIESLTLIMLPMDFAGGRPAG